MTLVFFFSLPFALQIEKPMQEKNCQIVCFIIKINNKKHVITKKIDSEKMARTIASVAFKFSIYCRCFLVNGIVR